MNRLVLQTTPKSALFILGRLKTIKPEQPLVVGSYAYLDGELHVRLSLAMDAIVKGLIESRPKVTVSLLVFHGRLCAVL